MTEPRYLRRVDGGTSPTTPSTSSRPTPTTATPSASPTTTAQTKQIHYPASWSSLVSALKRGPPSPAFTRRTDEESDESSPGFFRLRHVNVDGTIPTSASRGSRMTRPRLPGSMLGQDTPTAGSDGSTEPRFPRRPILARSRSQLPEGSSRLSYPPLPSYRSQIGPDNVNIVVVENDLSMVDQKGDITPTACPNSTPSTSATATPPKSCTRAGPLEYNHRASVWPCVPPEWKQRIWPALKRLHNQSFDDPDKELAYQREAWGSLKYGALLASVFFLITWVSWCSFMWGHIMLYWAYIAISGIFTVPLAIFVLFDIPLRAPWLYQFVLLMSVWTWPFFQTAEMHMCHFFTANPQCHGVKFLSLFSFLVGSPTISCLVMGQNRVLNLLAAVGWLGYGSSVMFGYGSVSQRAMGRNTIQFGLYIILLVVVSYAWERKGRQMYALREQLKTQYLAVQSAQVMERNAEASKTRFVSYIFHEVRVPLNTALLALENLKGEGMFKDLNADTDDMVNGLVASLSMMEKVLNDVLSFNRMESGQFAQVYHPFNFHKSIQLVARSHRAQAAAAGIDFTVDLDPRISQLGKLVGDEMRLRQVTGNLVSNALKFTPAGSVQVVTSLIFPTSPSTDKRQVLSITEGLDRRLSTLSDIEMSAFGPKPKELIDPEKGDPDIETRRNSEQVASNQPSKVVIRVEVRDTGVGISGDDFEDDYRLFSPYVQTEIGRRQGGKGSGLGLALSRQIVELSGGRLGVDSQAGVGSTFWFELPFSVYSGTPLASLVPPANTPVVPASVNADDGGSLRAKETSASEGAGFVVRDKQPPPLPIQLLSAPTSPTTPMSMISSPTGTEHSDQDPDALSALVVDDDPLTRKLMSRMLTRLGARVVSAINGQDGLNLVVDSFKPGGRLFDVVFLDNQMPRLSGVEAVRAMRQLDIDTFVVGCTGNALREDQEEFLGAGVNQLLPKPIHQNLIEEVLAEARARRLHAGVGATNNVAAESY